LVYQEGLGLVRGDVEIHVNQKDWQAHGHTSNPRYNSVMLHLVATPTSDATVLPSGNTVPVVTAESLDTQTPKGDGDGVLHLWNLLEQAGYVRAKGAEQWETLLDKAGDDRFLARSQQLQALLVYEGPEELLYQSLMESLGYKENTANFFLLAQGMSYRKVVQLSHRWDMGVDRRAWFISQLLLEAAGFLPAGLYLKGSVVPRERWHLACVRPANHPRRRIEGMAHLLCRFMEPGLVNGLADTVARGDGASLISRLVVRDGGGPSLIGRDRAGDMSVNVVLPFYHALSKRCGDGSLANTALELYRRHPSLQGNDVTREMERLLVPAEARRLVRGARRQQGLLHLHRVLQGARW
jgi:hypothetical protein